MSERSRALRKSFYGRLAVAGLVLIFLSIPVAIATGNATGAFSFLPPAFIALIVGLVLGISGRGLIVALVVSALAFLLFVVLEVLGGLTLLSHPESFADFVPALLRAVGSVMALGGSIIALVQARRTPVTLGPGTPVGKRLVKIGTVGVLALAVASGVLTYTRNLNIDAPPGALVVETFSDEFDPNDIAWDPGRHQVLVVNRDSYAHTFSVDGFDVDTYVGPRSDRLVTMDVPEREERYELYCAVTGHEEMVATIEVSG